MIEMLAAGSADWTKWVTPETIAGVLGLLAAVFGWLGKKRAQAVTVALVKGVEAFRNELKAKAADPATTPEKKSELVGIADALRDSIKGESLKDGTENLLNPIVQIITQAMKK